MTSPHLLRAHARAIWQAGVAAVRPEDLVQDAVTNVDFGLEGALADCREIVVVGGGKAGAAMSRGLEAALVSRLNCVRGIVNVPAQSVSPLRAIRLHPARPAGTNEPTLEGVAGSEEMLHLIRAAGPDDLAICLLSGGASALMPAPVSGITLSDKQQMTRSLHACGATIREMNTVRKHLSRIKGGRLAAAFTGKALFSLIISDVIGDPLEVIASGPTVADPTTFADASAVFRKFQLRSGLTAGDPHEAPATVLRYLEEGCAGKQPETPKQLPANVHNRIIGNNQMALAAAERLAREFGYTVHRLGSAVQGDTAEAARYLANSLQEIHGKRPRGGPPLCILAGGETTVTLRPGHGLGGRNQHLVLSLLLSLEEKGLSQTVVLCGGTDGEDGPTDAAGAIGDDTTFTHAARLGIDPNDYLNRQDSYHFFEPLGDLLITGLTGTNVMDLCVLIVA